MCLLLVWCCPVPSCCGQVTHRGAADFMLGTCHKGKGQEELYAQVRGRRLNWLGGVGSGAGSGVGWGWDDSWQQWCG